MTRLALVDRDRAAGAVRESLDEQCRVSTFFSTWAAAIGAAGCGRCTAAA